MKKTVFFIFLLSTIFVFSQDKQLWKKQATVVLSDVKESKKELPREKTYSLNIEKLKQQLSIAPKRGEFNGPSNVVISFPNPDGTFERYRIMEASVMHPDLEAKYPGIKSYAGQGVDNASDRIRFSVSPLGLQSMRLSADKPASFIEPYTNDLSKYTVYKRHDKVAAIDNFECEVTNKANAVLSGNGIALKNADDSILRTYRIAVSTTGEYTAYHGGTKALALAAINTTMTRVNGIFENDFNVTMVLIANNENVIYTNANTDPYINGSYNSQLQSTLTSNIGEANYDIGHLFARASNNGNAGCIGCVCVNGQKGSGFTSRTDPEGDPFDVDYVAHEIGHQFGANHTWTHGGNEGTNVQMEPGSGSTIMGYAGITGTNTDVQQNSDPYFHAASIEQVTDYVKSTSCQTNTNTGNAVPTVSAGANYTIPKGTAFVLTGSGSDANSQDVLTFCWEGLDENNSASQKPSVTATSGPAFRSYNPTTDSKRYFPRLATIKTGATSWEWEAVPNVARNLNFRLTVRDNRAGGATNNSDDMLVTVNGTAGPFVVNAPNTNVTWSAGTTQSVTWDVAGTTGNGINAANVDIFLSTDGGDTYPIGLASGVTNDGSHDIVVPNNQGSQNRIMVKGANNIFFDISNSNFTIGEAVTCIANVPSGLAASNVGSSTATLSWTAVPAATYDLRYRVAGTTTWTTNAVTGTSSNLISLATQTQYEAQVRSKCSGGSNSAYSASINFTTTDVQLNYCDSASTNINDEYIGRVQLGSIDNSSGGQFYTDFTTISTALTKGVSSTITVTPTWTGTVYSEGYSVWIDYNKDGDFTDSGEQVWSQAATQATPVSGSFIVPSGASNGATRMRVSMKYNGVPTSCETFTYGEVEDYTVILGSGAADTTAPVITLTGASTINLTQGDTYNELGATATDNVDGNLTSSIVITGTVDTNTVGTYTRFYNVSDAAGNAATQVTRTVNVSAPAADTTPPVITLNGASTINLTQGDTYNELGATATDNVDGNLTSSIITTGTVDTNTVGTYTRFYNVSDAAGNAATQVTRTVNVSAPAGDTQAPTTPTSLTASNIAQTTATLTWNASSDNVGVTGYEVFSSGSSIGTVTSTSANITGLTASTSYTYTVRAFDAAGNNSAESNSVTFTTLSNGGGNSTTLIHEGYFESGWDGWSDGGSDCARYSGSRSFEGTRSIRIRDNSGTSSSMTSPTFNLSGYDSIEFKFYFYANSMENGEDFWLRYHNGSSWTTVATWARGTSFNNNTFYSATVNLSATEYALVSNGQFRLQCDASGNNDHIYIDQVTIKGIIGTGLMASNNSLSAISNDYRITTDTDNENNTEFDFEMYPNPVRDMLNIKLLDNVEATYRIVNLMGQEVKAGKLNNSAINLSKLQAGMYIIEVNDGEELMSRKFIKQ